jgi:hypothetical protein
VIAFCTAAMNRLWQMEQTLPHNLGLLRGTAHFLALCNYNSTDGLDAYVRANCGEDIRRNTLAYFHTDAPASFHASRAKNTAHRLALRARPDVLFNLDADNFITKETVAAVTTLLANKRRPAALHHWSRIWSDGTFGRIALPACSWEELGGYDETLLEMAWQDIDLLFRARAIGVRYCLATEGLRPAVQNTLTQKLLNVVPAPISEYQAQARLREIHLENMVRSLGRPVILSLEQQCRYAGTLDFDTRAVV